MSIRESVVSDGPAWTRSEHRTTLVLQELTDGLWRATQEGVDVAGTGETPTEAAADYCRQVGDRIEG